MIPLPFMSRHLLAPLLSFYVLATGTSPAVPTEARTNMDCQWPDRTTIAAPEGRDVIWFCQPATNWNEALPLGNGRLGAMVFGGVNEERLQLNEDTLWSGAPHDYNHPGAFEHLAEIRKLIAEQKFAEAEKLGNEKILGIPKGQASYQPLGDLKLIFPHHGEVTDYRRELDLRNSIARVSYQVGGVRFTREVFISYPDQVMVVRLTCDQPGGLNFDLALSSPHPITTSAQPEGQLTMRGEVKSGHIPDRQARHPLCRRGPRGRRRRRNRCRGEPAFRSQRPRGDGALFRRDQLPELPGQRRRRPLPLRKAS